MVRSTLKENRAGQGLESDQFGGGGWVRLRGLLGNTFHSSGEIRKQACGYPVPGGGVFQGKGITLWWPGGRGVFGDSKEAAVASRQ